MLRIASLAASLALLTCPSAFSQEEEGIQDIRVVMKTTRGDLHLTIFATKTPVTAANFLNLAKRGFYDGVAFHAKDPRFYVQGGDPSGTGRGSVGYYIENEIHEELRHDSPGILSMSRKKAVDTNGSQFFLTLASSPHLDDIYSVFGRVTKGAQDVLPSLEIGDKITGIEILDSPDALFKAKKSRLRKWNRILDERKKLSTQPAPPAADG